MSNKSEIFVVQWLKTSTTSSKQKQTRQSILANLGLWLASVYLSTTTPWCFSWSSQPLDLELKQKTRKNLMRSSVHWKYWMDVFLLVQALSIEIVLLRFNWNYGHGHTSLCQMARHGLAYKSSHPNSEPKVLLFFSTHLALDSSSQSLFNYSGVSSNMVQVRNKMGRCMIHWMVIVVLYYYVFLLQALISSCELWYDIQRPDKCLIWRYAAMCTVCCIAFASMRFPICQVLNVPIYPSAEGATQHATEVSRWRLETCPKFHQVYLMHLFVAGPWRTDFCIPS